MGTGSVFMSEWCLERAESLVTRDPQTFSVWRSVFPLYLQCWEVYDAQCFKICSDFKGHVVYS